jgi:hypothetical protein
VGESRFGVREHGKFSSIGCLLESFTLSGYFGPQASQIRLSRGGLQKVALFDHGIRLKQSGRRLLHFLSQSLKPSGDNYCIKFRSRTGTPALDIVHQIIDAYDL